MATVEFYHDDMNNQGIITFKISDSELHKASENIGLLARLVLGLSDGSPLMTVQNLLIILEGIEAAKEKERKDAAQQN